MTEQAFALHVSFVLIFYKRIKIFLLLLFSIFFLDRSFLRNQLDREEVLVNIIEMHCSRSVWPIT